MEHQRRHSGLMFLLVVGLVAGAYAQAQAPTPLNARPAGTALAVSGPSPAGTPSAHLVAGSATLAHSAKTEAFDSRRGTPEELALAAVEAQRKLAEVTADVLQKFVLVGALIFLGLTAGLFLWRLSEAIKEGDRPRLESHWGGFGGGLGGWEISSSLAYLLVAAALTLLFALVAVQGTRPPRIDPPKELVRDPTKAAVGTSPGEAGAFH